MIRKNQSTNRHTRTETTRGRQRPAPSRVLAEHYRSMQELLGISRDLAEKAAQEWQNTFDSLGDMIAIQDANFRLIRVNKAYAEAAKMSRDDLLGRKCCEIMHGTTCSPPTCPHQQTLRTGQTTSEEFYEPHLSMYLHVTTSPLMNDRGQVIGSVHVARDITERKQAEERSKNLTQSLLRRTAELEAANKELEAFSYSVSHDLRAPLRSISGFCQALLEDCAGQLDDRGKDYLRRVVNSTHRMTELVDDLLRLSRATTAEMNYDKVNLSEIAEQAVAKLKADHPEREADFAVQPGLSAKGDAGLLRQVVYNLLDNAFKFTAQVRPARIQFTRREEGGKPAFAVVDNGAGFDMAYAHKLFTPFQRLHPVEEYPGSGIGLALVRRIINRHGGRVWAEGKPGAGATFYFTLAE